MIEGRAVSFDGTAWPSCRFIDGSLCLWSCLRREVAATVAGSSIRCKRCEWMDNARLRSDQTRSIRRRQRGDDGWFVIDGCRSRSLQRQDGAVALVVGRLTPQPKGRACLDLPPLTLASYNPWEDVTLVYKTRSKVEADVAT